MAEQDERAIFEAWVRTVGDGVFAGKFMSLMWKAWQARAAISTPAQPAAGEWQPIETAPKETEVLLWREDAGAFTGKWTSFSTFANQGESDTCDEDVLFQEDWFYGDFRDCGRLEGSELPTHWMPLPADPGATPQPAQVAEPVRQAGASAKIQLVVDPRTGATIRAPDDAQQAHGSEPEASRGQMTAQRAKFFMWRFQKEEKLLGPNEQAALDYVIKLLEAEQYGAPQQAQGSEPDMVSVCKEDANNYCRILTVLGMEEEGDPVAAVEKLIRDLDDANETLEKQGSESGEARPAYPEGEVVGPCVCGSWPGGKCLKCEWRHAANDQRDAALSETNRETAITALKAALGNYERDAARWRKAFIAALAGLSEYCEVGDDFKQEWAGWLTAVVGGWTESEDANINDVIDAAIESDRTAQAPGGAA